jgi:hypothetical protein
MIILNRVMVDRNQRELVVRILQGRSGIFIHLTVDMYINCSIERKCCVANMM